MATITNTDSRFIKFLDLVSFSEGTAAGIHTLTKNDGYDTIVTDINGPAIFDDYSQHPLVGKEARLIRQVPIPRLFSTAAGRYQILCKYWLSYKISLNLPDFGPLSQDLIALQMMRERHVQDHLLENDIVGAIVAASSIWASMPGNNYGQGGRSMQTLLDKYNSLV